MKKLLISLLAATALLGVTACENVKGPGGNQMVTGSKTYYYALVYSKITENRYYHIQGWAEYGPDGGTYFESAGQVGYAPYVGIELQLVNGDVIYRYEPGLAYELSKEYNVKYGKAIGD